MNTKLAASQEICGAGTGTNKENNRSFNQWTHLTPMNVSVLYLWYDI